jgi:DNA-binding NarL/FixJ family response regulator
MIKIAIAEDNMQALKALREKLAFFEDILVVQTAQNGVDLLQKLEENSAVDLVFMDIEMPEMNGIETTRELKHRYPNIKVIIISMYDGDDYIFNAIKVGADSYILKEANAGKIYESVSDTLAGGAVMSPSIALKAMRLLKSTSPSSELAIVESTALSERESSILEQISKGFSNKRIAENLFISPFTVKRHIENIYQKLKTHNRIELLEKARKEGLL